MNLATVAHIHDCVRTWFKGADTATMTKFLEHKYARLLADMDDDMMDTIHAAFQSANCFLHELYNQGLWIESHVALRVAGHGFQFLDRFARATTLSWSHLLPHFKLQPRLHMFSHPAHELVAHARKVGPNGHIVNPANWSCQLDEDFVGKISNI